MTRSVLLSRDVAETMRAHVTAVDPLEACGLLFGERQGRVIRIRRAVPCANIAEPSHRAHCFLIDPREVLDATRSASRDHGQMVGFFHSHPSAPAVPSIADLDHIRIWPGTAWLILSVIGGHASAPRAWWLDNPHQDAPRELPVRIVLTAKQSRNG